MALSDILREVSLVLDDLVNTVVVKDKKRRNAKRRPKKNKIKNESKMKDENKIKDENKN